MVTKSSRPTVADIRAMKGRGQKITMLYVTSLEEAAAADAADRGPLLLARDARGGRPAAELAAPDDLHRIYLGDAP